MSITNRFVPNDYNTRLGDCCEGECTSCLDAWCCTYCQVAAQYNMLSTRQRGFSGCMVAGLLCLDVCVTFGCALHVCAVHTRVAAKKELNLKMETTCETYMKGCCCLCCSVGQVYRELSIRHMWPGGVCVEGPYKKTGLTAPQPALGMGTDAELHAYPEPYLNGTTPGHPPAANGYPAPGSQMNGYPSYNNQQQAYTQAAMQPVQPQQHYMHGNQPPQSYAGQLPPQGYGQPQQPVYGYQGQTPVAGPKTVS
jgi:Cys-rich protein (TIGR01571 family)